MKSAFLGVLLALGVAGGASAQDRAVERGRTIAETWCANCHAIGEDSQPSALADAPPFEWLAAQEGFSEETVRQALLLPHPVMPEFPVTAADVAALAAYIASLGDGAPSVPSERTEAAPAGPVTVAEAAPPTADSPSAAESPSAVESPAEGQSAAAEAGPSAEEGTAAAESAAAEENPTAPAATEEAEPDTAVAGDLADRGRTIVERDCSPCHAISGPGPSPVADAPAFATLSQLYPVEFLAEALAEGIMVPHETVQMPQYSYEPDEIGAILAHLERVQLK